MPARDPAIAHAEVVLPCRDLAATLAFFTDRLGFRLQSIFPADDPRVAVIDGFGVRLRLQRGGSEPAHLRLVCAPTASPGGHDLEAPNGTRIELVPWDAPAPAPRGEPEFVFSRSEQAHWVQGRAGMLYRDLVPGRQGGRLVASHIRIPHGGPVPDYVHHHDVRLQLIYCCAGWVRVAYEDQGPPFTLRAGDCVLQPPNIRHRVLECSDGLEVIEVGSPAEHETHADHDLSLPTGQVRPERRFAGQRFVRHVADAAAWLPWRAAGFCARDLGIADATGGQGGASVVRANGGRMATCTLEPCDLQFGYVLQGGAAVEVEGNRVYATTGDAWVLPPACTARLVECTTDLELLVVSVPAG